MRRGSKLRDEGFSATLEKHVAINDNRNTAAASHEFQRDGITICTTFTPFKPENARLLVRKNDIIIDIHVMYDHSKGTTLILSKKISLLVTIKGV